MAFLLCFLDRFQGFFIDLEIHLVFDVVRFDAITELGIFFPVAVILIGPFFLPAFFLGPFVIFVTLFIDFYVQIFSSLGIGGHPSLVEPKTKKSSDFSQLCGQTLT